MHANAVVTESSVDAGAAAAELPLERCCIGALCAQKLWRVCFAGKLGACIIGDTLQQRYVAVLQANAVSQRVAWVLVPLPLKYLLSDAYRCMLRPVWWRICFGGKLGA
jgi:hypothetical protein